MVSHIALLRGVITRNWATTLKLLTQHRSHGAGTAGLVIVRRSR
jgi:hypothetical protein